LSNDNSRRSYFFLTPEEVLFFESFCSFVVPTGPEPKKQPGAKEVGSVNYVDSTLFDFPKEVQEYFRGTVRMVNEKSTRRFGREFAGLSAEEKDRIVRELFLNHKTRERIFDLRSIALEGFYSDYRDPDYKGVTPWQLIKFGGKRISDLKKDWTFLRIWKDYETLGFKAEEE
jgi:hypothetical protein